MIFTALAGKTSLQYSQRQMRSLWSQWQKDPNQLRLTPHLEAICATFAAAGLVEEVEATVAAISFMLSAKDPMVRDRDIIDSALGLQHQGEDIRASIVERTVNSVAELCAGYPAKDWKRMLQEHGLAWFQRELYRQVALSSVVGAEQLRHCALIKLDEGRSWRQWLEQNPASSAKIKELFEREPHQQMCQEQLLKVAGRVPRYRGVLCLRSGVRLYSADLQAKTERAIKAHYEGAMASWQAMPEVYQQDVIGAVLYRESVENKALKMASLAEKKQWAALAEWSGVSGLLYCVELHSESWPFEFATNPDLPWTGWPQPVESRLERVQNLRALINAVPEAAALVTTISNALGGRIAAVQPPQQSAAFASLRPELPVAIPEVPIEPVAEHKVESLRQSSRLSEESNPLAMSTSIQDLLADPIRQNHYVQQAVATMIDESSAWPVSQWRWQSLPDGDINHYARLHLYAALVNSVEDSSLPYGKDRVGGWWPSVRETPLFAAWSVPLLDLQDFFDTAEGESSLQAVIQAIRSFMTEQQKKVDTSLANSDASLVGKAMQGIWREAVLQKAIAQVATRYGTLESEWDNWSEAKRATVLFEEIYWQVALSSMPDREQMVYGRVIDAYGNVPGQRAVLLAPEARQQHLARVWAELSLQLRATMQYTVVSGDLLLQLWKKKSVEYVAFALTRWPELAEKVQTALQQNARLTGQLWLTLAKEQRKTVVMAFLYQAVITQLLIDVKPVAEMLHYDATRYPNWPLHFAGSWYAPSDPGTAPLHNQAADLATIFEGVPASEAILAGLVQAVDNSVRRQAVNPLRSPNALRSPNTPSSSKALKSPKPEPIPTTEVERLRQQENWLSGLWRSKPQVTAAGAPAAPASTTPFAATAAAAQSKQPTHIVTGAGVPAAPASTRVFSAEALLEQRERKQEQRTLAPKMRWVPKIP